MDSLYYTHSTNMWPNFFSVSDHQTILTHIGNYHSLQCNNDECLCKKRATVLTGPISHSKQVLVERVPAE